MKTAIYAGSFDPPTLGHVWMIERGAALFGRLIVAVGTNTDKAYAFSIEERLEMLKALTKGHKNVRVESFENQFLVKYAKSIGVDYIIRGIRTETDFAYERDMRLINGDLEPRIETVFLMPPREIAEISSSFVKGLVGPQGWEKVVSRYLPPPVYRKFIDKLDR
jgi:pantetheine-phosphate adenylyltransferase